MRWLMTASQRFWTLVIGALLALGLVGGAQLRDARLDVLPELSSTVVNVQTEALGLSAAEVEQLVTVPLEQNLLNGVAWLDEIRSESMNGLSSIEMHFEQGTDVLAARQMVAERLTHAHILPRVTKPPVMLQPVSSSNRLMVVELSSSAISAIELSVLARWNIRPRLMGVPGVANVAVWGQRERQLQVQVTPEKLKEQGVTLNEVVRTAANALWVSPLTYVEASTPGSGGFIDAPNQRLGVRHVLPISSPEDLAKVVMTTADGRTVRLGDVAEVVEDHQPLIGDAMVDGGRGLALVIEKFPGESTTGVTEAVEDALRTMAPGLTGVEVDTTVFRPAGFLTSSLSRLGVVSLLCLAVLLLVLSLAFRGWRATVVSFVAVLASVLVALLVLHWLHTTFNLVVLAGLVIALGVIIDDAVMAAVAIGRRGGGTSSLLDAMGPLMFATVAIVCVTTPLLLVEGPARALFRTLGFAYLVAVLASTLVALTVTPALATMLRSRELTETSAAQWVRGKYETLLERCQQRPRQVWAAAGVLLFAGLAVLLLPSGWPALPPVNDQNLVVSWIAPASTSRTEMVRITDRVEKELTAIDGVRNVAAHVGRATISDQVVDVDSAQILIGIDSGADHDATVRSIRETISGYPGMQAEVLAYPDERIQALFESTPGAIGVRIYGNDDAVLQQKATEIRDLMARTEGVRNVRVDAQADNPTIRIEVDLAAAQQHGVKPGDVRRAASAMLAGIEVGSLFEEQKVFDVLIVGAVAHRQDLTSIQKLLIDTPGGQQIPLRELAKVEVTGGPPVIRHEAVARYLDVLAEVSPGFQSAQVNRDVQEVIKTVSFPKEHHAEVVNEPSRDEEHLATGFTVAAASVAVFLLLQAVVSSWWLALALMLLLPAAAAGGVIAAVLTGATFSFGVIAGLVAVAGMTIRWMVQGVTSLQRGQGADRLMPVLVTTAATAGAMAIVALAGGPGLAILRPIAIVVIGGLITSAATVLLAVPVAYSRWRPTA